MQQYQVPSVQTPDPGGHEFTAEQNKVISRLATRMFWAGLVQIVFGCLQLVGNCSVQSGGGEYKAVASAGPFYLIIVIVGALLIGASRSFKRIVTTQGADVRHLMSALGSLSKAALVEIISFVILGVVMLLVLAVMGMLVYVLATMFGSGGGAS
jgi:hypothetical protein